jgi:ribose transport system substrate-binding protein
MIILNKRAISALLAGSLFLLAGCTRHSKNEHYYLIATNTKVPYWQTAAAGFTNAAAQDGVTAEMRGPDGFDPQAEVQEFRTAVASKPAGILISVADAKLMTPEIDSAIAAGIPVITVDSDAPDSHRLYFIGTNNLEAGRLGGNHLATLLKGKGNVVFFTNPSQPNLDERLKGYKDVLSGYPGIKIVDVFDIKGDSGNAMDKARDYLALTGAQKVDAMVCLESASGRDVAEAFKRAHAAGRTLIAMDVDEGTLELVKDGTIDSTVAQKPYTMGLLGLKALDDVFHYPVKSIGENYRLDPFSPFPAFVDTGVSLIDKTNVDAVLTQVHAAAK